MTSTSLGGRISYSIFLNNIEHNPRSSLPRRWRCLCALVQKLPRVGSPEGLTVQTSWFMRAAAPSLLLGGERSFLTIPRQGPVPPLWISKESVKVLCLVQPSRHRGGAAGPQGGAGRVQSHPACGRVRVRTRSPVPRPAVCPWLHAACDKYSSSILQAGILPRPPLFCTNLPRPPEEGTHCC